MDTRDIVLWTVSITLAVVGIVFGVIASINSSKANRRVREMIKTVFVTEEAQRYFYHSLKDVIVGHRQVLKKLNDPNISYYEYSIASLQGRMVPISKISFEALQDTEYINIAHTYIEIKNHYDKEFKRIFTNLELLSSNRKLPKTIKNELIDYHRECQRDVTELIKQYNNIAVVIKETTEIKL